MTIIPKNNISRRNFLGGKLTSPDTQHEIDKHLREKRNLESDGPINSKEKGFQRGQELRYKLGLMHTVSHDSTGETLSQIRQETQAIEAEMKQRNREKYGDEEPSPIQKACEAIGTLDSEENKFSKRDVIRFPKRALEFCAVEGLSHMPIIGGPIKLLKWLSGH